MQKQIPVGKIYSSSNCRKENDDTLKELAANINAYGLLLPIAVREVGSRYEIIDGHRRFAACKMNGDLYVECNVVDDVNDKDRLFMQVSANIQNKSMSAYELVQFFDSMVEKYGCTDKQLAAALGKSSQWVYDTRYAVKLLHNDYGENIPEDKKHLSTGMIKATHKRKTPEAQDINGNGFSCKKKGHTYMIFCTNFDFEQKLNALIQENR